MAIAVSDVTNALSPIIQTEAAVQVIVLCQTDTFVDSVLVDSFASLFANATDMTAASLNAIDGGEMGYSGYISEWKSKGYIS